MITMSTLLHLLVSYGYLAVLLLVALESMGIPAPGETILLAASVAAGTTHQLALPLIIAAAASGAIIGDNLGYWIGSSVGVRLLRRSSYLLRRNERKLKLGLYLFQRHGGKVVFFGRFVTVLRMWAAVLAGICQMRWRDFLGWNALGGLLWATGYGLLGYLLGSNVYRFTGPLGFVLLGLGGCVMLALFVLLHKRQRQWEVEALRLFPGPLEAIIGFAAASQQRQNGTQTSQSVSPTAWHEAVDAPQTLDSWGVERTHLTPELLTPSTSEGWSVASETPVPSRKHDYQSMPGKHLHPIRLEPFLND